MWFVRRRVDMKKSCKQFEDTLNTLYKTKSKFYNGYLEEVKKQGYKVYRDSVGNHKIEFNVESNENSVVRKKKINSKKKACIQKYIWFRIYH